MTKINEFHADTIQRIKDTAKANPATPFYEVNPLDEDGSPMPHLGESGLSLDLAQRTAPRMAQANRCDYCVQLEDEIIAIYRYQA